MPGTHHLREKQAVIKTMFVVVQILCFLLFTSSADAEFYTDRRCTCVCPGIEIPRIRSQARGARAYFQDNRVSPEECNCNDLVLPHIVNKINGSLLTYCIQCICRFETRNTTIIVIVVISLLAIISLLMMYMACLYLLQKLVKHHKNFTNQRLGNEEQLLGLLHGGRHDTSDDEM